MEKHYPDHIYEKIRRDIAVSYIRRELKKLLPSISDEAWADIRGDIENWFSSSRALYPVRDFWNGLYGIMMGFKLIDHLGAYITAENVVWTRERLDPTDLLILPEANGEVFDEEDPIIVTQKQIDKVDRLVVYDGNNRANGSLREGKKEIEAFVGRFTGSSRTPENYWLPTPLLMDINHFAKKAYIAGEMPLYRSYVTVLSDMLAVSESGVYEMRNRVIPQESEYRTALFSDLGLS